MTNSGALSFFLMYLQLISEKRIIDWLCIVYAFSLVLAKMNHGTLRSKGEDSIQVTAIVPPTGQ